MKTPSNNIGRREFFSKSVKVAAAGTLLSPALAGNRVQAAEDPQPFEPSGLPGFIIDSHIHCGSTEQWVEDMVRIYRPYHAMACVLTWMDDMELMVEAIKSHPDVFIGYGRVNVDDPNEVSQSPEKLR